MGVTNGRWNEDGHIYRNIYIPVYRLARRIISKFPPTVEGWHIHSALSIADDID